MKCTTWKLVDSNNNPADIVSRGAKPINLLNNTLTTYFLVLAPRGNY